MMMKTWPHCYSGCAPRLFQPKTGPSQFGLKTIILTWSTRAKRIGRDVLGPFFMGTPVKGAHGLFNTFYPMVGQF
jgi:hypothetical protein